MERGTIHLGTIDGGLVHALHNGRPGTQSAEEVEHEGLVPPMRHLLPQDGLVTLIEYIKLFEAILDVDGLRHECALVECFAVLGQPLSLDEGVGIGEDLLLGEPQERILELGPQSRVIAIVVVEGRRRLTVHLWRGHLGNCDASCDKWKKQRMKEKKGSQCGKTRINAWRMKHWPLMDSITGESDLHLGKKSGGEKDGGL